MVGDKGSGSDGVAGTIVRAVNDRFPQLIRTVELPKRTDGRDWEVGDDIGLYEQGWREAGDGASVTATITKVFED
jgi:hypothetical protein